MRDGQKWLPHLLELSKPLGSRGLRAVDRIDLVALVSAVLEYGAAYLTTDLDSVRRRRDMQIPAIGLVRIPVIYGRGTGNSLPSGAHECRFGVVGRVPCSHAELEPSFSVYGDLD